MNRATAFLDYASLDMDDLDFTTLKQVLGEIQLYPSTAASEVLPRLENIEVAIVNKVKLNAETLKHCPKLKLILISATGTNNVDLDAARQQGIVVCNCQGYGTASVAQHTLSLMLALATSLVHYDRAVQQSRWQQAEQFCMLDYPIVELSGKTLGILGYGELGQEVARLARAFGMQVMIGNLPNRPKHPDGFELDELLPKIDVLSLHCPLTEQTKNLIDRNALAKMKTSAFLINCARGGIVNEADLADALIHKSIAGAAVDVLSIEPPRDGNVLLYLPPSTNLIITPHSAWGSVQARQRIVAQLAENARQFFAGQPIRQVN